MPPFMQIIEHAIFDNIFYYIDIFSISVLWWNISGKCCLSQSTILGKNNPNLGHLTNIFCNGEQDKIN